MSYIICDLSTSLGQFPVILSLQHWVPIKLMALCFSRTVWWKGKVDYLHSIRSSCPSNGFGKINILVSSINYCLTLCLVSIQGSWGWPIITCFNRLDFVGDFVKESQTCRKQCCLCCIHERIKNEWFLKKFWTHPQNQSYGNLQ